MQKLSEREDIYKAFSRLAEETQTGLRLDECKRLIGLAGGHRTRPQRQQPRTKHMVQGAGATVDTTHTIRRNTWTSRVFTASYLYSSHHRYILRGKHAKEAINVAVWINRNMDAARHTRILYVKGARNIPQPDRPQTVINHFTIQFSSMDFTGVDSVELPQAGTVKSRSRNTWNTNQVKHLPTSQVAPQPNRLMPDSAITTRKRQHVCS
jgi:hypothetical protein